MTSPTNADVARVIQAAIDAQAISINQLADLSLVDRKTITRKLADLSPFTVVEMARLAHALGIRPSDMLATVEGDAA